MNLHLLSHALLAATLLIATGCSKSTPEAAPSSTPTPVTTTTPAKPTVAKSSAPVVAKKPLPPPTPEPAPEPEPAILFSLRGLAAGQLANDQPLLIGVRIEASAESAKPLALAPATGSWRDGLKVELVAPAAPDKVLLTAHRVSAPDDTAPITLGESRAAEGTWYFPSAEIATLVPGDYTVRAQLAITDGTGWHGQVASEPAAFTLVAAAAATTPEQQTQRAIALAGEAMLAKDWPKAAQLLDECLATDPDNIDLLKTRGLLCLEGGNALAANACASRAWARVTRENWAHPPADLYVLSQAVMAAMAQPSTAAVPAWTQPPAAVLAPLPPQESK